MEGIRRHEKRFRAANKALLVLAGMWLCTVLPFGFAPPGIGDTDWRYLAWLVLVASLILCTVTLSFVSIVAYIRWTGKYPYYFLFRRSRERVKKLNEKRPRLV